MPVVEAFSPKKAHKSLTVINQQIINPFQVYYFEWWLLRLKNPIRKAQTDDCGKR